jgi:DNA-binding response OmpR family regulator
MTILIVDDDRDIREMLTETLADEGYDVTTAADGQEALTDPRLAPIPVVVISARPDIQRAVSSIPVAGYVPKPIDFDQLLNLVKCHCSAAG